MKEDAPAFLTITSLQLPDSPIPLIDSQAIARASCPSRESTCSSSSSSRINDDKDAIMDELLRKVVAVRGKPEGQRSKRDKDPASKCNREFTDLEECTRRIIEGPGCPRSKSTRSTRERRDCICSEVTENLRINIRKKTEVRRSSRSPSPEITHVIRIAMKYHGQQERDNEQVPEAEFKVDKLSTPDATNIEKKPSNDHHCEEEKEGCNGVSVALDFTLNCSSLQLTSRDVCVRQNVKSRESTIADQVERGSNLWNNIKSRVIKRRGQGCCCSSAFVPYKLCPELRDRPCGDYCTSLHIMGH